MRCQNVPGKTHALEFLFRHASCGVKRLFGSHILSRGSRIPNRTFCTERFRTTTRTVTPLATNDYFLYWVIRLFFFSFNCLIVRALKCRQKCSSRRLQVFQTFCPTNSPKNQRDSVRWEAGTWDSLFESIIKIVANNFSVHWLISWLADRFSFSPH